MGKGERQNTLAELGVLETSKGLALFAIPHFD